MKNEEEKVAIRDKMPVVTKETIDAVRAHEAAEDRRYQEECSRKYREWHKKLDTETLEKIRKVFPGADKNQFEDLYSIFADYFEATR
jgi:hypothetical protein